MPTITLEHAMPQPADVVFDVLHDYDRRLEWDTLLRSARLTGGCRRAAKGATSLCVGKTHLGRIGIESRYIRFDPGRIAAVEMINRPPFFDRFAASIKHLDTPDGSTVVYRLNFTARPKALAWLLHPIMRRALRIETQRRLQALARYLQQPPTNASSV